MKVAVVGIGVIAPLHLDALKMGGHEIVALCDVEREKCEKANKEFGLFATVYEDFETMLESETLDAVHICTPHYLHASMICKALSRKINVLCEKPLAISADQLSEIEDAVKHSTAKLGVCFQNRYNKTMVYVREFFKDKEIKSAYANLTWCRDAAYYALGAWRGSWAQEGGGVMINQAIHSLDILQWLCGMPDRVTAHLSNDHLKGVIEVEETAFGIFTLPSGNDFTLHATNASTRNFPVYMAFKSETDTVEVSGENLIVNGEFLTKANCEAILGKAEWGSGHAILIRDYYRCLREGERFPIGFDEAKNAIKLILAMYESNGTEIQII